MKNVLTITIGMLFFPLLSIASAPRGNHLEDSSLMMGGHVSSDALSLSHGPSYSLFTGSPVYSAAGLNAVPGLRLNNHSTTTSVIHSSTDGSQASSSVPEPQSYALMIAGLAALAFMATRRGQL